MACRRLWLPLCLVLGALACAPGQQPTARARPVFQTREARARDLASSTVTAYAKLGLKLNANALKVKVRDQAAFVQGIARNSRYFELPGLYDALSATARLFGANFGRSPAELRTLSPLALGEVSLAYYDFDDKILVLRDDRDANAMSLDEIVAHELAHAHQDLVQGGLKAYIAAHSNSPDGLRAAHSVLEGQATLFTEALRLRERGLTIQVLDPNLSDPSVGRLTNGEGYSLIYEAGRRFLLMRYRAEGLAAIVDAFKHPPSSTEQLLHPDKLGRDLPRPIDLPPLPEALRNSSILFDGALGEMLLYNRLLQFKEGLHETRLAVTGWDGDRLRVLRLANGSYGVVWRLVWDRPKDALQFCSFVSPLIRGEAKAQIDCHNNVTDLTYAETPVEAQILKQSLMAFRQTFQNDAADAQSTLLAETEYERLEGLRPTVVGGRWRWPRLGLSFAVPEGFFPLVLNGVDILAAMPEDGFSNNVTVTFEQDLFAGDLSAYVREQERIMHTTNQIWKGSYATTAAGRQAFVVSTLVPGEDRPAHAFLLLVPRENGTLLAITVATSHQGEALGQQLISGVAASLEFQSLR